MNKAKWLIFSHWSPSPWLLRMDATSEPAEKLEELLSAHHEPLVVVKAFETAGKRYEELAERFADCRKLEHWYALRPALKKFLEEEAMCETLLLKKLCQIDNPRLHWRPVSPDAQRLLYEAQIESDLPGFVKNAERFVLWAIDDLIQGGEKCYAGMIIKHPANRMYKPKTIYNTIALLQEQGKLVKMASKRIELSPQAQEEIDGLKKVQEIKERKRRGTLRV